MHDVDSDDMAIDVNVVDHDDDDDDDDDSSESSQRFSAAWFFDNTWAGLRKDVDQFALSLISPLGTENYTWAMALTPIIRMVPISHHLKHCSNAAKAQNGESEPSTSDGLRGPIQPAGSPTVVGSWSIHTKSLLISNVVTCQASQTSKAARPARNMNVAAAELAGRTAHRLS